MASMTRLRHQILDTGVLITGEAAGRPVALRVTETEAKRFAWSLLNDLDPEEDDAFQPRVPVGQQRLAILKALAVKPLDTAAVGKIIVRSTPHAAVVLSKMKSQGLVAITRPGVAGLPAMWALLASGRQQLEWREQAA